MLRITKSINPARLAIASIVALLFATGPHALADSGDFRGMVTTASSGVVDEKDQNKVEFKGARAQFKGSRTGQIVLRYDIESFNTINDQFQVDATAYTIRFRDNGPDARIVVKLKYYDMESGKTRTVFTIDSDTFQQGNAYQFVAGAVEVPPGVAAWWDSAVYLEVTLSRTSTSGKPALGAIGAFLRDSGD